MKNIIIKGGSIAGALTAIFGLIAYMGFTPVFASEFQEFKGEFYGYQLEQCQTELRKIKIEIYYIESDGETAPPFLLEEKLSLEDKIGQLQQEQKELAESDN